ncbi:hypothetical protein G9F32_16435 [Acinetobacter sp. 194]|uniref:hypothetical protein n=1 Tax=Acinetobacter shaoyimingii TaxID=2715164 RepID=UPI00140AD3CA|nr:hypothetical protein [Acinetobacter shaoyimingii]NHB59582.1 hypothetical protein [Acinetobacter shaoyimingii]
MGQKQVSILVLYLNKILEELNMKFYTLYSFISEQKDFIFNIEDKNKEIFKYFFIPEISINNIKDIKIINSIDVKILEKYDFFPNSLGIPLFSKRAFDLLNEILTNEVLFIKCSIKNSEHLLYAAKFLKFDNIIESEDGMNYIFFLKNSANFKYCAQDIDYSEFLYTKEFIDIIKNNNLNIKVKDN